MDKLVTSKAKRIGDNAVQVVRAAWLLYLALVPIFFSVATSLIGGEYRRFVMKLIAFVLFGLAAMWVTRGIRAQAAYERAAVTKAPVLPQKMLGALSLGVAIFYTGRFIGETSWWQSAFIATLGAIGVLLYYGLDPRKDKLPQTNDVNPEMLLENLTQARQTLRRIEDNMERIDDRRLHRELSLAVKKANRILNTIEEDPKDIRVARKFLVVYLDGVAEITQRYLALDAAHVDEETRMRLLTLLQEVQTRFDKELERLRSNEKFDLDVQIDALRAQLNH